MQVYYFTRTGRSKEIAEEIAKNHGVPANQITDEQNWKGPLNFLRGGYFSSTKKETLAKYKKPKSDETIVLVFPIWAGSFPPSVRTFLNKVGRKDVIAVPTSLGSALSDRDGFSKIYDLKGKVIETPKELLK